MCPGVHELVAPPELAPPELAPPELAPPELGAPPLDELASFIPDEPPELVGASTLASDAPTSALASNF
jgi:hypothetical protein